jgi:hypothetical protein
LIAAVLLLIPRTSHIGALLFLPIIINVAVLTSSVGFRGTWIITLMMCLAAVWLAAWEYDRLKLILFAERIERTRSVPFQFITLPGFFALGGVVMAVLWKLVGLGNFSNYLNIGIILGIAGLIFGILVATHYRFMRVGALENGDDALG